MMDLQQINILIMNEGQLKHQEEFVVRCLGEAGFICHIYSKEQLAVNCDDKFKYCIRIINEFNTDDIIAKADIVDLIVTFSDKSELCKYDKCLVIEAATDIVRADVLEPIFTILNIS